MSAETRGTHTPGPWEAGKFGPALIVRTSVGTVCEVTFPTNGKPFWAEATDLEKRVASAEARSNARLIAAAPDLLEALESIENDDGSIPDAVWDMRNHAIAKARGTDQ